MKNRLRNTINFIFRVAVGGSILFSLQIQVLLSQKLKDDRTELLPVTHLLSELGNRHPVRIFFDRNWFAGDSINISLLSMPFDDALNEILTHTGFEAVDFHESIILLPRETIKTTAQARDDGTVIIGNPYEFGKYTRAKVSGTVSDDLTGEELIGVLVYVEDLGIGTTTDANGRYNLELPAGDHSITISYVGYEPVRKSIKLASPGELDVSMFEESQMIDEVTIFARREDSNISHTQMSMFRLDSETITQLPTSLGERDILRSLTLLPGIQTIGEFGSGFHVRGGSADQNLILVEGVPLFNSSHLFGLTSLINPDLVTGVTLIKGGIPARYGERSSSVMDIRLGSADTDEFEVKGGVGLLNSRLSVHSPLPLENGYIVVGGRSSYSDWLLTRIPDEDLMNSSARFHDISGIGYVPLNNNNNIKLFGYYSYDGFGFGGDTDYNYSSTLGSIRWNSILSDRLSSSMLAGHSDYYYNVKSTSEFNPRNSYDLESKIQYNNFRWNLTYYHDSGHALEAGVNAMRYEIDQGSVSPFGDASEVNPLSLDTERAVEMAGYLSGELTISPDISVEAGLRYTRFYKLGPGISRQYDENQPKSSFTLTDSTVYNRNEIMAAFGGLEPRISMRYQLNSSSSVKMSLSRINQFISLVSNTSLPTPADVWYLSNEHQPPMRSDQIALGLFKNLFENNYETSIEVYYKQMQNIIEPVNNARILLNPVLETDLANTRGNSYGAELYLKKVSGNLHGWLSYTWSRAQQRTYSGFTREQINENSYFPANFDTPHNLVVNANLQLSRRWRLGSTFSYNSGRPVTLPEMRYMHDGEYLTYFSDRNKYRLPDFHRLDISLSYDGSLRLSKSWYSSWTLSVVNLYGRKNVYSTYYEKTVPSQANNYQRYSLYNLYIIGRPLPTITYNFNF